VGHLWRWTTDPVGLLEAGAGTGEVFQLRLWRPVVVGYRPDWNRAVLSDLETFRNAGSLSDLTPYLAAGVVHSDVPAHDQRRRALNLHLHAGRVQEWTGRLREVVARQLPRGRFEAVAWAERVVRGMLNAVLFGDAVPERLLARFLAPLQRSIPAPLLPRPRLFRRMEAAIGAVVADPVPGTLAAALVGVDGSAGAGEASDAALGTADAVEELRVMLAAGYDTTTYTLAWALWYLAAAPRWRAPDLLPAVIDEVTRLYPAGWIGSRVVSRDVQVCGVELPTGTLVVYSPYLTHRDPRLWPEPLCFRPERFAAGRPAWGFIPFAAGRRSCLGACLARAVLRVALEPFCAGELVRVGGDATLKAGVTLRPRGPLWISWTPPQGLT